MSDLPGSLLLCCLLVVTLGVICHAQLGDEVTIPAGTLRGVRSDGVINFLGIPYAKAPVGDLRWKKPQPHPGWSGVWDATKDGMNCPQDSSYTVNFDPIFYEYGFRQINERISEDCLFLNIHVPEGLTEKAPVLFWIHGGGFAVGSASFEGFCAGDILAARTSSVVVGINYRLNVFGFLHLDHPDFPSNLGLLDQNLALRWVQENIHHFNGDPDSVTIFGESAGGMSVMAHLESPQSDGLFHAAIPQSGIAAGHLPSVKEGEYMSTHPVAKAAGCSTESQDEMISCLQGLSMEELVKVSNVSIPTLVTDGEFLVRNSFETWSTGQFNKVPLMISICSDDGGIFVEYFNEHGREVQKYGISPESTKALAGMIGIISSWVAPKDNQRMTPILSFEYELTETDPAKRLRNVYDMSRDASFGAPSLYLADAFAKAGEPVYLMLFDQAVRKPSEGAIMDFGAAHADDLAYVFGNWYKGSSKMIGDAKEFQEEDHMLTDVMMKAMRDFSRGLCFREALTVNWKGEDIDWPQYTLEEKSYIVMNNYMRQDSVKVNPFPRAARFWNELVPALAAIPDPECPAASGEAAQDVKDEL